MNRKFTEDEIAGFYVNEMNRVKPRKWIYNPEIHGPSKEEFERKVKLLESGEIYKTPRVLEMIKQENKAKIDAGEKIVEKPWDLNTAIDRTGINQGIDKMPFFSGWRPLF